MSLNAATRPEQQAVPCTATRDPKRGKNAYCGTFAAETENAAARGSSRKLYHLLSRRLWETLESFSSTMSMRSDVSMATQADGKLQRFDKANMSPLLLRRFECYQTSKTNKASG